MNAGIDWFVGADGNAGFFFRHSRGKRESMAAAGAGGEMDSRFRGNDD
jgi:hypothetical protein